VQRYYQRFYTAKCVDRPLVGYGHLICGPQPIQIKAAVFDLNNGTEVEFVNILIDGLCALIDPSL